ncbi:MAG: hypothetical protein NTX15_09935, partial [Candidatus Kapabacteria bacterium]|nr:hypothetical protein [Candidatus Kapabacteria bacterium]
REMFPSHIDLLSTTKLSFQLVVFLGSGSLGVVSTLCKPCIAHGGIYRTPIHTGRYNMQAFEVRLSILAMLFTFSLIAQNISLRRGDAD